MIATRAHARLSTAKGRRMGESPRVCCQLAAHRRTPPTSNNTASATRRPSAEPAPGPDQDGSSERAAANQVTLANAAAMAGRILYFRLGSGDEITLEDLFCLYTRFALT